MEFGWPYEHKDGLGDQVTSSAEVQSDNTILITARGSRSGVVTTVIQIKEGDLWLTQTMPEKEWFPFYPLRYRRHYEVQPIFECCP